MRVVKPSDTDRDLPRGIVGGAEISQATTGAHNIYMGLFRVPAGARSRPHYHADCESALYMLKGGIEIRWGDDLEQAVEVRQGDMLYVPPRETHIVRNLSDTEPAEYVVARDSPTEDSVEVPWAGDPSV
ncbi:MAG TPA: cupin domain-containing protein [Solirubrobacteraceae bacterium]|nr:cupin domain-containing protein [Solirubrobacteraceae bacterium]